MTDAEQDVLGSASIAEPWALVEAFSGIAREHPDEVNRAGRMIADRLRANGVPVTVHEPRLYLSLPKQASVQLAGRTLRAKPPSFAASCPEGVEGRLVIVTASAAKPLGYAPASAHLFGQGYDPTPGLGDVRGCIAAYHGLLNAERISQLEEAGAAAVIAINPGTDVHWGAANPVWGTADLEGLPFRPRIPSVAVSHDDAAALEAAVGATCRVLTELEEGWFNAVLPVVEIAGSAEPDRFVLLHGHYDSWSVGVGDNATGDAAMLEVARVLWQHRAALRRSVRIAWWPGHSTGKFAGSTWYCDQFAHELMEGCVAHLNCDSPGVHGAVAYDNIPATAETFDVVKRAVQDVTGVAATCKRPSQSSDYSFSNLGISGLFSSSSRLPKAELMARGSYYVMGNGGDTSWHTERDTLDVADPAVLLADIKVYLLAVLRLACTPVLPLDWRILAAEFGAAIGGYQNAAGERFDLSPVARAAATLSEQLDRLYVAIEQGVVVGPANAVLLRLARLLVPLNYSQTTAYRHDPGVTTATLPMLSVAGSLDRYPEGVLGFAQAHLLRGMNHVVAGMTEAAALAKGALDQPASTTAS